MKENNDIFDWGELFNLKSLYHLVGSFIGFWICLMFIKWLKIWDFIQLPKFAAAVAVVAVAFFIEFYQMRISRAKIDLTDMSVAVVGCAIGWLIF